MARILLSGASGFIGRHLVFFLKSQGHSLVFLSRLQKKDTLVWDLEKAIANPYDFKDFDVVIHLAAEPLTPFRWSKRKKRKILFSRSFGTAFLSDLLIRSGSLPKLFISASAIGFYGDRGEEILREDSCRGDTFLAEVCARWEEGSLALQKEGVRTVQARFGLVLGRDGGIFKKILPVYKWGLGATLGDGNQWMSWIHIQDLVRALSFILDHPELKGPVNIVSKEPLRQREFSKTLASTLRRPHLFSLPAWALCFLLGQAAEELLLSSTRVECAKLLDANFDFLYPGLAGSFESLMRKTKDSIC